MYAFHGVLPQEKQVGGWFNVSLRVHYNITRAMASDDVNDTLSYAELCEMVKQEMAQPSNLLEHIAGRIARKVLDSFPQIESLDLTVTKENPPMGANCNGAGVELHCDTSDIIYLINDKTKE